MIYTIGHEATYLANGRIKKRGRHDDYAGGYAFLTVEDAQERIAEAHKDEGYAVFGLLTDWGNTYPASDGWWNLLIEDAEIVVLEGV